jgi:23S rRNA (cytosine1962-C5)-methyltransferase
MIESPTRRKKQLLLKKFEDKRVRHGHLWIFSNEIKEVRGEPATGDIVDLCDHSGKILGVGFYNPNSLILLRLLSTNDEPIDFRFFETRIQQALSLRTKLYPDSNVYRLVHGESDYLPGLVIDRYEKYFSVQTFSYGMDKRLTLICDVLESMFHPKGIVERNESSLRALEHMEERKGILRGSVSPIVVSDGTVLYEVDLLEGQKTGLFLDQRENRFLVRRFAKNARTLDCFCNDGGFALHAAHAGAKDVVGVDSSAGAVGRCKHNARLNQLQCTFVEENVFVSLERYVKEGTTFDLVILDPPSFTRSKKAVATAKRGYRGINGSAMRLLAEGGILATSSCSHHISREDFRQIISESAQEAKRRVQIVDWRGAAPDHPALPAMPETEYLKFALVRVL